MPVSLAGVDPDGFALGQVLGCLSFNMDQGNAARDVEALSLGVCASAANVTAWAARPASSVARSAGSMAARSCCSAARRPGHGGQPRRLQGYDAGRAG
uniref:BsaU protein n=1 Tax=Cutibacterium acnes TaxID=1747 RepID=UPI001C3F7ECB|nr:BsaU protein [Cutibacterium acnes]